jgi:uncharacterized protein (TIGR01777 family)
VATHRIDDQAFDGVDTLIYLAGATLSKPWTRTYRKEIFSSRVDGILLIHEWLSSHKHTVQHYIGVSGTGAYGHRPGELLREDSAPGNGFLGELSVAWERAHNRIPDLGIRTMLIRQGLVFGYDAPITEAFLKPMRFLINPIAGSGKQHVPWIYLDDLLDVMLLMIRDASLVGTFNAVAPGGLTNEELCNELKAAYHRRTLPTKAPAWLLRLMLGERAQLLLADTYVVPERLKEAGFQFKFPHFSHSAVDMAKKALARS